MKIKEIIDDYVIDNKFQLIYKDEKLKIINYGIIKNFSDSNINILSKNHMVKIKGNKMIIESMFKEYVIISGNINNIVFEDKNE